MSVQFGRWSFDVTPPPGDLFENVNTILAPYGPDGRNFYQRDGVSVLYRAFHTTKESRSEIQPHVSPSGAVVLWDGRLDNRAEIIALMSDRLETTTSPDVSVVALAYERWGKRCLPQLRGDWALAIWDPNDHSLTLAKDPIGIRPLYYSIDEKHITWSTILDPLVLLAGRSFALNEEYIAGCFASFPAAHLTPYVGIDAVPPACSVRLQPGSRTISKYWDFDPGRRVRYRQDAEYEEHFRSVFTEAVRRRLRSDSPVLAELSGGLDSSSIVCTADMIIAQAGAETPRLDTLSYFSDSEPNWDERTYFTQVEDRRGRTGWHIDVSGERSLFPECENSFAATPASANGSMSEASRQLSRCASSQGNRVVLSGIGGDEIMGGVPTPIPELMDLLARAQWGLLARQLKLWALNKRKPWFQLFLEAVREFLPPSIVGIAKHRRPQSWLTPAFIRAQTAALTGYQSRIRLAGPLPSYQENISTLHVLRRQVAYSPLPSHPPRDVRYPYLDRDLLEFMYAIPREQCVRPGQRRSLMRRALTGIVPDEVLNRKRKAFVVRAPIASLSTEWARVRGLTEQMRCGSLGMLDPWAFSEVLEEARRGREVPIVAIMRTLGIEIWLRRMSHRNVLSEQPTLSHRNTADNPIGPSVARGIVGKQIQPGRAGCR
jgi:asparagine synthase (glutamine-hydrolysing)